MFKLDVCLHWWESFYITLFRLFHCYLISSSNNNGQMTILLWFYFGMGSISVSNCNYYEFEDYKSELVHLIILCVVYKMSCQESCQVIAHAKIENYIIYRMIIISRYKSGGNYVRLQYYLYYLCSTKFWSFCTLCERWMAA